MALLSHIQNTTEPTEPLKTDYRYCRKTIFIMKYSEHKPLTKISLNEAILTKMAICLFIVAFTFLSTKTAEAGFFSSIFGATADEASAQTIIESDLPTSQNMALLKAAVNTDPNPNKLTVESPQISGNALVAHVGPSGTVDEVIEEKSTTISIYVVRDGDNLSQIADMFDVSVNTIIWANDLGSKPIIHEGQTLVILPISGIQYTVKRGDTIKGIVSRHNADLEDVLKYNSLSLDSVIKEGDIVVIPDAEPARESALAEKVNSRTGKVSSTVHDADGPSYPGYYVRPIRGGVRTQGLHGYNAVDLATLNGASVYAAAEGMVIASVSGGWNGGYGNYVIISHPNGTQTLYSHNSKNLVKQGDYVEQGEIIAKVGATGHATGPHVHFEIRGAKNPF